MVEFFNLIALDFEARRDESVVDLPAFAHDDELGEALVLRKLAVDGVKQLQQAGFHDFAGLAQGVLGEDGQGHWLRKVDAKQADLFYLVGLHDAALDGRRGDVLALGGLENVFDAARNVEVAVGVEAADVAGVQGSAAKEFCGEFGLAVVALGVGGALQKDFVAFAKGHAGSGKGLADAADADFPAEVHRGDSQVFGHAVDLLNHNAQAGKLFDERGADGGGATEHKSCSRKPEFFAQDRGQGPAEPGRRQLAVQGFAKLFPNARNRQKHCRLRPLQVRGKRFKRLHKVHPPGEVDAGGGYDHAFRHVAQRQVAQKHLLVQKTELRQNDSKRFLKGSVAVHDALGHSGSARGVNDCHQVVGVQGREDRRRVAHAAYRVPTSGVSESVVGGGHHLDSAWNAVAVARHVVELAEHHDLGLGMLDHCPRRRPVNRGVDGHRNGSGQRHRVVVNEPVRGIFADQGHPVTRLDTQGVESAGEALRLGVGLGVRHLNASAPDGLVQKQTRREGLGVPGQLLGHQPAGAVGREVLQALFGHKTLERTQNFEHPGIRRLLGVQRHNGCTDAYHLAARVDSEYHNRNPRRLGDFVVAAAQAVDLGTSAFGGQGEAKIRVAFKVFHHLTHDASRGVLVDRNCAQLPQKPALNSAKKRLFAQNVQVVKTKVFAYAESGPKVPAVGVRAKHEHVLAQARGEGIAVLPTALGKSAAQKADFH